jgi:hypothetical protein
MKQYLIVAYAYLVKTGEWDLDAVEGETKQVVPDDYKKAVAEYIAKEN